MQRDVGMKDRASGEVLITEVCSKWDPTTDSFYYHSTGMRHPSPSAEQGMLDTAFISLLVLQWGSTAFRQGTTDPEVVTGF